MVSSPLISRALAIGLACTVLSVFIVAVDAFFVGPLQIRKENYAQHSQLLAEYVTAIERKDAIDQAKSAALRADQTAARFLAGTNEFQAGATLQDVVKKAIYTAGGTLRSVQPVETPPVTADLQPIIVRAEFGLDMDRLTAFLALVDQSGAPTLWIDRLEIRAPERHASASGDALVELRMRADITALMRAKPGEDQRG